MLAHVFLTCQQGIVFDWLPTQVVVKVYQRNQEHSIGLGSQSPRRARRSKDERVGIDSKLTGILGDDAQGDESNHE